jgi:hypothetical protein
VHQQNSWTWGGTTEITVNLWSLHAEDLFGAGPRLAEDNGEGRPTIAAARAVLAAGAPDFLIDDGDTLFLRLVMFRQLQRAYGWDFYADLCRHFRRAPLPWDATDQAKADALAFAASKVAGADLRGFFARWGLRLSPSGDHAIAMLGLSEPEIDPATLFEP